jgi:hypothetical protein
MLLYEWANRTTGEILRSWLTLLPQTSSGQRNMDQQGSVERNKKLEATEADEFLMVDENEYYKDIESDDDDEEFKDSGKHAYQRSYSTRNTKANQDEYEERSPAVKRKSNSPALSANKKMKSQGDHEKNKSGADIDRKMPAAQLPLANIKMEEQDDWKKDIQEMSKAIKGLVEVQVKTNEKMSKLESRSQKKTKTRKIRKIRFKMTRKKHQRNKSSICETVQ